MNVVVFLFSFLHRSGGHTEWISNPTYILPTSVIGSKFVYSQEIAFLLHALGGLSATRLYILWVHGKQQKNIPSAKRVVSHEHVAHKWGYTCISRGTDDVFTAGMHFCVVAKTICAGLLPKGDLLAFRTGGMATRTD